VRPIADRRRDWEQVVQDGDKYGAKLYDTNCVMFCPNGDIEFQSDSWATPTTASFYISVVSMADHVIQTLQQVVDKT
jgi:hypothetical protein